MSTATRKAKGTKTGHKARTEPPWDVILHNDWVNSTPRMVPGMSLKKATRSMYEAHSSGRAVVKRCRKELAELYKERLQEKGLTVSLEPAT